MLWLIKRWITKFKRPSKAQNTALIKQRGENIDAFIFREATINDLHNLVTLHVKTWADTYWDVKQPPTYQIREYQWKQQFSATDSNWFCIVIENERNELIGFAKGIREKNGIGDLGKIYLLSQYQRLGLGQKLLRKVAERFIGMGVSRMSVFADVANPSCLFYEAMGGERARHPNGKINYGGYFWSDLKKLI